MQATDDISSERASCHGAPTSASHFANGREAHLKSIPPIDQARVTATYANCALRTARELGADMNALGKECGFDASTDLDGDISVSSYLAFLNTASIRLKQPLFGMQVGFRSRVTDATGYSSLIVACKDVRAVLDQVHQFEPLAHDLGRSELLECGATARIRVHSPWMNLAGVRHFFDYAASGVRTQARWLTSSALPFVHFSTTFDPPDGVSRATYERALGGAVSFGAEFNEVSFPAWFLSIPIPSADGSVFSILRQLAQDRLARYRRPTDSEFIDELRERLRKQLKSGRSSLTDLAVEMRLSSRTLQRRLARANASFAGLLGDIRREEAKRYLRDESMPLSEVAFLLGFSEQSSFNHAFQEWFGTTPGKWRAQPHLRISPQTANP